MPKNKKQNEDSDDRAAPPKKGESEPRSNSQNELEREITQEMKESYLDYAMSVIVSRALPDTRDGLKPVHRRVLYVMHELGLGHSAKMKKSANVVGAVLGGYHPHGDNAVYDSLVRMAQDFSLRYPLVEGQGNFGCFTKDTKVKLTDGRDLSFGELIQEHKQGKHNFTYTVNFLGRVAIAEIKHPRVTKQNAALVEVILDNAQKIHCTPDHRFMLKNGSYVEAQNLQQGDSLMPFYEKLSKKTDRLNREGYTLIYQPKRDEWIPAHHLADNYNLTQNIYHKNDGRVRHHKDYDKNNNNPTNIMRLHWGEHWRIHHQHASAQHQDPEYRRKIAAGRKAYWALKENREKNGRYLSERNKKNWQDTAYREKMRAFLSEMNKEYIQDHPEKRLELSERATKTLKRLWQDPAYRAIMHLKIIKGNKNHITNKTGKLKFLAICQETLKAHTRLTQDTYETMRGKVYSYGKAPLWKTGLEKYFQGQSELVLQEINKNHKVRSVKILSHREDVYDLTIDGTHNFALSAGIFVHNSIDGDRQAAMRYTETRMSRMGELMLADIEKETVPFVPNYDGSRSEPVVLPTRVPQLLLNGSLGIAVGMATNIPPHNLGELARAIHHLIENPKATTEDLMEFVKGPDFPTGGIIYNKKDIHQAYATGKGGIVTRGEAEIVENKQGNFQIIISSIPFQVNKSTLIEKIAELVHEKRIEGIRDMRDESDKDGMRIAVDIKNGAFPQKILNSLYKHTDLERTFHVNMLALVDGLQPQVLSLKNLLEEFIKHRHVVIERRTHYDLKKAKERAHVLEGLKIALDHIDEVIKTIRASADKEGAHKNLIAKFRLTPIQTTAILEMRLQTLAGLERKKVEDELKEKKALIAELESILNSQRKIRDIIIKETEEVQKLYPEERRTRVVAGAAKSISTEDLVPEEESAVILTKGGYIKRVNPEEYRMQKRGGKGTIGIMTKEEDVVDQFVTANTHDELLFFTSLGKAYQIRAFELPEGKRVSKGKAIANFLALAASERVTSILPVPKKNKEGELFLTMITEQGVIKKTDARQFTDVRRSGIIAIKLQTGDRLGWVHLASPGEEIIIATRRGLSIRFKERDVRPMGRASSGVRAIRLKANDMVVGANIISKESTGAELLVVAEMGYGKKTKVKEYKVQNRGGGGIKTMNVTAKTGVIVSSRIIPPHEEDLIVVSTKGQVIRTPLKDIPSLGRSTQGVRIMKLEPGDKVASVTTL